MHRLTHITSDAGGRGLAIVVPSGSSPRNRKRASSSNQGSRRICPAWSAASRCCRIRGWQSFGRCGSGGGMCSILITTPRSRFLCTRRNYSVRSDPLYGKHARSYGMAGIRGHRDIARSSRDMRSTVPPCSRNYRWQSVGTSRCDCESGLRGLRPPTNGGYRCHG